MRRARRAGEEAGMLDGSGGWRGGAGKGAVLQLSREVRGRPAI